MSKLLLALCLVLALGSCATWPHPTPPTPPRPRASPATITTTGSARTSVHVRAGIPTPSSHGRSFELLKHYVGEASQRKRDSKLAKRKHELQKTLKLPF